MNEKLRLKEEGCKTVGFSSPFVWVDFLFVNEGVHRHSQKQGLHLHGTDPMWLGDRQGQSPICLYYPWHVVICINIARVRLASAHHGDHIMPEKKKHEQAEVY